MKQYNVLIVEDEEALSQAYKTILEKEGYNVTTAANGEEALKITAENEPDIILLDLRMPKVNGTEFLKRYDLRKKHPSVKVIVFSNLDTQQDIDEAYSLGTDRYMLKAWASPKELAQLVKETLSAKKVAKH